MVWFAGWILSINQFDLKCASVCCQQDWKWNIDLIGFAMYFDQQRCTIFALLYGIQHGVVVMRIDFCSINGMNFQQFQFLCMLHQFTQTHCGQSKCHQLAIFSDGLKLVQMKLPQYRQTFGHTYPTLNLRSWSGENW